VHGGDAGVLAGVARLRTGGIGRDDDAPGLGIYFVRLAPVTDPRLVLPSIAQGIGLPDSKGRPLVEHLADHLRDRKLLIVLDNFEQLLAAATVVAALLSRARDLHIVVSSRSPLRVSGEQECLVPPLALPEQAAAPLAALAACESVRLFAERAAAVVPDFAVDQRNAAAVAGIVRRLDGLPVRRALRDTIVPAAFRIGPVHRRAVRRWTQVNVAYPASSLTRPGRGRGPLRPGQRAADIEVLTRDGATRLFSILRRGRHVMAVTGADPESTAARQALQPYRELLEAVTSCRGSRSRAGSVVLVRPDGYVTARGTLDKLETVLDYLRELMVKSQAS
jgi:hypothetical protein